MAPSTPATRPQSAAAEGEPHRDTGTAVAQSRKVAIQSLVEVAIGDLETRLLERVLARCAAADDAVKRYACATCPHTRRVRRTQCFRGAQMQQPESRHRRIRMLRVVVAAQRPNNIPLVS